MTAARRWLAAHLSWLVALLLALWLPPFVFLLGVKLGWLPFSAVGYPALTDPVVVLTGVQLAMMITAMVRRGWCRPGGLTWLLAAVAVGWLHALWTMAVQIRLTGMASTLAAGVNHRTVAALSLGTIALLALRGSGHDRE